MPQQEPQVFLFKTLLEEGQRISSINLSENEESYTVFMLLRFMKDPYLLDRIIGISYLEGLQLQGHQGENLLLDTGDRSLLLVGLYPGRARRLNVSLSYFVNISRSCYNTLSSFYEDRKHPGQAELYKELAFGVEKIADVLVAVRGIAPEVGIGSIPQGTVFN